MAIVKKISSLVLFSGGLDSLLAVKILEHAGANPTALIFTSYFFDANKPLKMAQRYGLTTTVKDISEKHLDIVKKPAFGYGKNMNPCLDCHLLMLTEAKKIAKKEGYTIIATGEVLGQRAMSQNKQALTLLEKKSGLTRAILRPLSAKVLPRTTYEQNHFIKTEEMYDISGKGRSVQLRLAKKFNLDEYETPSGGCILTDPIFGDRLKKLSTATPAYGPEEIILLRSGRIFWIRDNIIVIGRNQSDNEKIEKVYKKDSDLLMRLGDHMGPLLLARNCGKIDLTEMELLRLAGHVVWHYPKVRSENSVRVKINKPNGSIMVYAKPVMNTESI